MAVAVNRQHVPRPKQHQQHLRRDITGVEKARRADKFSRVLFPFTFLIFNIIYWMIFVGAPI